MSERKQIHIIFRDGEVHRCYLNYELRDRQLINFMAADDQNHRWSITSYPITEDI